jgi:hypothetical protein
MDPMDLVGWLTERQRAEGLSDARMAERLTATGAIKISRQMWSHIRRRRMKGGPRIELAQAACLVWPAYREQIGQLVVPLCAA